jgi:hypothetical protein
MKRLKGPQATLVLQNLILGSSIPDALLQIYRTGILKLLEPAMGLGEVLQSSGFDTLGVRVKLESVRSSEIGE